MAEELCCRATSRARRLLVVSGGIAVCSLLGVVSFLANGRYLAGAVASAVGLVSGLTTCGGMRARVTLTDDRLISREMYGTVKVKRSGIVEVTIEPFLGRFWRIGPLNGPARPLHQCVVVTRTGKRVSLEATRDRPAAAGAPGPHVAAAARHIDTWLKSMPVGPVTEGADSS